MTVTNAAIAQSLSEITGILGSLGERLGALEGDQPTVVKATKASTKRKGKKSSRPTTTQEATVTTTASSKTVHTLTKKTRVAFIEAHDWAEAGQSVSALSALALSSPKKHPLAKGWKVATFREAKAQGLTTSEFVAARKGGATVVALKPARGRAANTRQAKAEVATQRNALGQITPKVEWALRAALKAEGFKPKAVDKKVRKARNKGLVAA